MEGCAGLVAALQGASRYRDVLHSGTRRKTRSLWHLEGGDEARRADLAAFDCGRRRAHVGARSKAVSSPRFAKASRGFATRTPYCHALSRRSPPDKRFLTPLPRRERMALQGQVRVFGRGRQMRSGSIVWTASPSPGSKEPTSPVKGEGLVGGADFRFSQRAASAPCDRL